MITTGSSSLELKFDVHIGGCFIDYTSIQRVNIELQENMHNLAILDVAGISPQELTNYVDAPIQISIAVGSLRKYEFVGYISHLEPESVNNHGLVNNSPFQTTKMYCFGASYVMKSRRTTVWNNKTLPQIAKEMASKYSLNISVPNDPYIFPRLTQSGKSDWALLTEAAQYLGYSVLIRGVTIDIWDPFMALSNHQFTPLYAMSENNSNSLNAKPGQVLKFKGTIGAVTPISARTTDTIYALVDNQIASVTKTDSTGYGSAVESIFSDEVSKNADSVDMANAILKGRSKKKLPYTAEVTVVGDPTIQPGMVVNLEKYNSGLDGLWIVQAVRHEVFRGSALTYLTMAKDSNKSDTLTASTTVRTFPEFPAPLLRNSRWTTIRELSYVY